MKKVYALLFKRVTDTGFISEDKTDKTSFEEGKQETQVSPDEIGIGDFYPSSNLEMEEKVVLHIDSKDVDRIIKLLVELKFGDKTCVLIAIFCYIKVSKEHPGFKQNQERHSGFC